MTFFDRFKEAKDLLQLTIDLLPEFYRSGVNYANFICYLNNNDIPHALDSILLTVDIPNHYFSDNFWSRLARVAEFTNELISLYIVRIRSKKLTSKLAQFLMEAPMKNLDQT